jgi:hypothetical protein
MISNSNFGTSKQRQINACPIFLQVISPSDITTFDGKMITQVAYDELRDPVESKILWPNQQGPPKSWWDKWRNFLLLSLMQTYSFSNL